MPQHSAAPGGSAAHVQALMASQQQDVGGVRAPAGATAGTYGSASASGSAYTSSSASGQRYVLPVVPALRLCDVTAPAVAGPYAADGSAGSTSRTGGTGSSRSGAGSSVPGSGHGSSCGSSYRGSTTAGDASGSEAAPSSSRSLMQQRSVKPILMSEHPETPKRAKHVQISSEDTVFAFFTGEPDGTAGPQESPSPGGLAGAHPQQQQQQGQQGLPADASGVSGGVTLAAAAVVGPGTSSENRQADAAGAAGGTAGVEAAAAGPSSGALSRSSSARQQRGSQLSGGSNAASSPRSQGSARQPSTAAAGSDGSPQPVAASAAAGKKRGSRGSKLAVQLPQLLLTDAEDACAAEAATPAGEVGEHRQVCFTPQAPEQGGKRNAILMRQLHKGRSLKHLEDMMLAVAGGGELGVE